MLPIDEFRNRLKEIMSKKNELATAPMASGVGGCLFQEEGEEDPDAAALDALDKETTDDGTDVTPDAADAPEEAGNDAGEEPASEEPSPEETETSPEEQPAPQNNQSDSQKVQEMFKDTGVPEVDYSLSNENNVRLYKFKFTYAGIDVNELMKSDDEKKSGLTRKELESRLSPEHLHYYTSKWKSLREKYQQIPEREKNICIHNANIMLLINNQDGEEIPLPNHKQVEAYKKINVMMDKKFGPEWQDLPEALNFLKNIKINFSNKTPVRTNLLSVKVLEEKDKITGKSLIPFNKIYVDVPTSVQNFIRVNQESQIYNDSSIFQALASDYKEADRTVGTMDVIIKGAPAEEEAPESGGDSGGGDSGGGGGGMGDLGGDIGGGGDVSMPDTGEETADTDDTSGAEDTGDTGDSGSEKTDSVL
jgi:hypothetical protein